MVSLRLVYEALNFKKIVPIIKNQAVNLQTINRMKSQRAYQILVVFMLILPLRILSQEQMPLFAQKIPHILKATGNFSGKKIQADKTYISDFSINNGTLRPLPLIPFPFRVVPIDAGFTIQNLPFFCKKEFLFEKTTAVPLRVRLGSLEYVNKLEGKENHWSVVPDN
jgi:hypothetical protein